MFIRSALAGLVLVVTATSAFAGPSAQHSAEASYHSGEAAAHASGAAVTGAATVAAVRNARSAQRRGRLICGRVAT
ncbi:MAG: hypothetical protein AAGG69_14785 [Pseudomonadota bacterium]